MENLKFLIFAIVLIIIIVGIILTFMLFDNKQNSDPNDDVNEVAQNQLENENTISNPLELHEVDNVNEFFEVVNCVNQYLGAVNKSTLENYGNANIDEIRKSVQTNIYNLLSQEYIETEKITENNVYDYVEDVQNTIFFIPLKMKVISNEDQSINRYIVYGIEEDLENTYLKDLYIIVNTDKNHNTFSIEPMINETYHHIDEVKIDYKDIEILQNENNQIQKLNINDEYISQKYLDYYKKLALGRPDIVYELIDDTYKEKRFGSLEIYEQYIDENRDDIKVIQLSQYMVNRDNANEQYICRDEYGKIYIFEEYNPMQLSIQLDTYTIETDAFTEQYDNGNDQIKVQMNINKFILMLNNQDYEAAYQVLDDNFKSNYFNTLEEFENYVKTNMYKYNNVNFESFDVNGNVYSCTVTLTDLSGGKYVDETKGTGGSGYILSWDFVVQLKDNHEFAIAFEVV